MSDSNCSLPNCTKPIKRAGYCYGHYMKNWRYGTPTPTHESRRVDLAGQVFDQLTVIEAAGHGWLCRCSCGTETIQMVGALNRGDVHSCGDRRIHRRRDDAGYTAAHRRVRQDRGEIATHRCDDCGGPARHWSYNHDDPDERLAIGLSSNPIAYSLKPNHYSPRCVPCHKRFDLARINSTAPLLAS